LVAGRNFQLYFLFIATYITTMSAPVTFVLFIYVRMSCWWVFSSFLLTYVLCYAAAPSLACVFTWIWIFFSIFVWSFSGYGKTRGKKSVFLVLVMNV